MISVAFKIPLKTRLGIRIFKALLLNQPDGYWFHTKLPCPSHFITELRPCCSTFCKKDKFHCNIY